VIAVADVEDGVKLFEREGFGLREEEVAVHPAEEVPASVPAEGTGRGEGCAEGGPGEGDDEVDWTELRSALLLSFAKERKSEAYIPSTSQWRTTFQYRECKAGRLQQSR
jgi:hypothetical protein